MRICEANTRILRAKPQPYIDAMLSNLSPPCAASTEPQTRGESNSMQGASVKQTRSVCSERARTPAGGRSRCVFAKQIRGSPRKASTRYRFDADRMTACRAPRGRIPSTRGESNSVQGVSVKQTLRQRRAGRAFPMAAQAESTSRNPCSDWDVVSGWRLKRKLRPGIEP